MRHSPVVVSLPIADRRTSLAFYRDGLGLDPVGEPAEDGVPEPLQFELNDGFRILLAPTGGFERTIGGREVAQRGRSECVLVLPAQNEAAVDELIEQALEAAAEIITDPGQQPWGYAAAFADPDGHVWMVRSDSGS